MDGRIEEIQNDILEMLKLKKQALIMNNEREAIKLSKLIKNAQQELRKLIKE